MNIIIVAWIHYQYAYDQDIYSLRGFIIIFAKDNMSCPAVWHTPLVELLVANRVEMLKHHIEEGAGNAQYTSFSSTKIIEAIDTWVDQRLEKSLKANQYFTIMADECEDVSLQGVVDLL